MTTMDSKMQGEDLGFAGSLASYLDAVESRARISITTTEDVIEHAPLALYLVAVTLLSFHLIPRRFPTRSSRFFVITAFLALLVTWYYMIAFLFRSYHDARRLAGPFVDFTTTTWLQETSLFKQAWEYVCVTSERWWFSAQLCTFTTGTWTVFLFAEASRRTDLRKRAWQYMLLGQIVAISFASSLFLSLVSSPPSPSSTAASEGSPSKRKRRASSNKGFRPVGAGRPTLYYTSPTVLLAISSLCGLATTFYVPSTTRRPNFLSNLLAMHAILFVPLIQLAFFPSWVFGRRKSAASIAMQRRHSRLPSISVTYSSTQEAWRKFASFRTLYYTIAALSAFLQIKNTLAILQTSSYSIIALGEIIRKTLFSYPAQSSISFDVVCTHAIWQAWAVTEIWKFSGLKRTKELVPAMIWVSLVPTLGGAVGISAFLAEREKWLRNMRGVIKLD